MSSEIIAVKSRKTSTIKLLEKIFLLGKFVSISSFLSSKPKITFLWLYW